MKPTSNATAPSIGLVAIYRTGSWPAPSTLRRTGAARHPGPQSAGGSNATANAERHISSSTMRSRLAVSSATPVRSARPSAPMPTTMTTLNRSKCAGFARHITVYGTRKIVSLLSLALLSGSVCAQPQQCQWERGITGPVWVCTTLPVPGAAPIPLPPPQTNCRWVSTMTGPVWTCTQP